MKPLSEPLDQGLIAAGFAITELALAVVPAAMGDFSQR